MGYINIKGLKVKDAGSGAIILLYFIGGIYFLFEGDYGIATLLIFFPIFIVFQVSKFFLILFMIFSPFGIIDCLTNFNKEEKKSILILSTCALVGMLVGLHFYNFFELLEKILSFGIPKL